MKVKYETIWRFWRSHYGESDLVSYCFCLEGSIMITAVDCKDYLEEQPCAYPTWFQLQWTQDTAEPCS